MSIIVIMIANRMVAVLVLAIKDLIEYVKKAIEVRNKKVIQNIGSEEALTMPKVSIMPPKRFKGYRTRLSRLRKDGVSKINAADIVPPPQTLQFSDVLTAEG